jgi:N-dimethylarginine dimethylaminohydrolase
MLDGAQSEVGNLSRLVLKHARDAFSDQATIDRHWKDLGYEERPDLAEAVREYERLVTLLEQTGASIEFLPPSGETGLDSIYVRDASVVCDRGVILCNMGKPARRTEPQAQRSHLVESGLPICGAIDGTGRLEGGDLVWLDRRTVAVGRGYRTNAEGIGQLRELLGDCIDALITVPLPHWRGPGDVFHLMSILSPIDEDLLLVYSPLLPVPFREALLERGFELVEVPDDEFESMACNVLALAPRRSLMLSGNPRTRRRLEACGVEVLEYEGSEISRKGAGGPTCLTRPLVRA